MKKGRSFVIAVDGPDGVGKTTQLELLREYLQTQGLSVHATRASGGTPIGEALRRISLSDNPRPAETDLYISFAMFTALAEDLPKHQEHVILIDRSPLAITAYNAYGSRLKDKRRALEATAHYIRAWQIDVLVYLDAPQHLLNARRRDRQKQEYFENQGEAYHRRVRQGYEAALNYLSQKSPLRIVTVDATREIPVVQQRLREIVSSAVVK